jgi:FAD-dependent urate hydroxylase
MNDAIAFPIDDPGPHSLAELEARLACDLDFLALSPPAKDWLEPRAHPEWGPVLDIAIVGAGMAGLSAGFALKCLGVRNMRVFDRSLEGFEGPWATFARMETLRSPPELAGPAIGFANLTFRAWFEAQFGRVAWTKVHRIPRLQWLDYLRWYRKVTDLPIENRTELVDLTGDSETVLLTCARPPASSAWPHVVSSSPTAATVSVAPMCRSCLPVLTEGAARTPATTSISPLCAARWSA